MIVARAVTCPSDGLVPIRILNPRECSIELKKGSELAKMDHIGQDSVLNVSVTKASRESSTTNQLLWELVNKVGDCLGTKEKEQLYVHVVTRICRCACSVSEVTNWGESQYCATLLAQEMLPQSISSQWFKTIGDQDIFKLL